MKRKALLLIFTAVIAFAVPARAADVLLFAFAGYDYQDPNSNPVEYLDVGEGYHSIGFVTSFGPDLESYVDPDNFEYTMYTQNLVVIAHTFYGTLLVVDFGNGGRGRYYSDPIGGGTHGVYSNTATFTDGTIRLGGVINSFNLTYDFDPTINAGQYSGTMNLDEGPDLIYIQPASRRNGWTFAGTAGAPNPTIPPGYDHQVQGECRLPASTPTTHRTWGAMKALYR
jgi:hypothetical protein